MCFSFGLRVRFCSHINRLFLWSQVEAHKDSVLVGHVADEPAQRLWQFLDERRGGDDLLALGQRWLLVDVDDFQFVAILEVLLANRRDVRMAAEDLD